MERWQPKKHHALSLVHHYVLISLYKQIFFSTMEISNIDVFLIISFFICFYILKLLQFKYNSSTLGQRTNLQLVNIQKYFTIWVYRITMTFVRKTIPAAVTRQWKSSFLHIFRLLNWGSNCRINWSPRSTPPMVWLYLSTTEGMEISQPFPLVVWRNLQIDTLKFKLKQNPILVTGKTWIFNELKLKRVHTQVPWGTSGS